MIERITKQEYPDIWPLITDDVYEESYRAHRKQSNFFVNWVYRVDKDNLPDRPELWGFWETDTLIHDTEYGCDERIETLHRVTPAETVIVKKEWRRVV